MQNENGNDENNAQIAIRSGGIQDVYVVKVYSTSSYHIIKAGKSTNIDGRMKSFKTIAPELALICQGRAVESEVIRKLSKTFEKVGQELFKVPIDKGEDFLRAILSIFHLNGNDRVDSFILTGCHYSHFTQSYQYPCQEHERCSDRCKFKIAYNHAQEWLRKERKYTCMTEYHPEGRGCNKRCYPNIMYFSSIGCTLGFASMFIEKYTFVNIYLTEEEGKIGIFEYKMNDDKCVGIKLKIKEYEYRTVDNGDGKLVWQEICNNIDNTDNRNNIDKHLQRDATDPLGDRLIAETVSSIV